MCGEFPADQLNRLIPSASYAEKLITDLKAEHLIRTHYRDALRGYRLTKAAKTKFPAVVLTDVGFLPEKSGDFPTCFRDDFSGSAAISESQLFP